MKCRSCGLEIADKAIVCYRCGTPTADVPRAPEPRRESIRPLPLVLAFIIVAAWVVVRTPTGSPEQWGGLAVVAVGLAAGVLWWRRRRRS